MINNNKKNYLLNYVPMIDSECQTQRYQPTLATSNFYRSPLRDRENRMNISNTPVRTGKPSLSPLRMRKNQQSYSNVHASSYTPSASIKSTVSRRQKDQRSSNEEVCFNHADKVAKFFVQTPQETMYCCEKCAILLASQGFKIAKLSPDSVPNSELAQSRPQQNIRRKEQIEGFLSRLQQMLKKLKSTESVIEGKFQQGEACIQQQLSKVEAYYDQFHEILNEHKQKVITELKEQFQKTNKQFLEARRQYKEAVQESDSMKSDILESWNDIIFVAEEEQYRPVINAYNQKLRNFQKLTINSQTQKINESQLNVRKLYFKNIDEACEALARGLQIQWADQLQAEESNQSQPQEGKENQQEEQNEMARYSQQSDLPQNPIECVEKEEKFIKSSLKDLAGLFCSFDE